MGWGEGGLSFHAADPNQLMMPISCSFPIIILIIGKTGRPFNLANKTNCFLTHKQYSTKGANSDPSNYHPVVSLTSIVSKMVRWGLYLTSTVQYIDILINRHAFLIPWHATIRLQLSGLPDRQALITLRNRLSCFLTTDLNLPDYLAAFD